MPAEKTAGERFEELTAIRDKQLPQEAREETLHSLVDLYEDVAKVDSEMAREIRLAFLLMLNDAAGILSETRFSNFLAEHIEAEDFKHLEWEAPHQVMDYWELLYDFQYQDESTAEAARNHVRNLLRHALRRFNEQGDLEKMFQLFQLSPYIPIRGDPELVRLRNRAFLYEKRRVLQHRRILYGYLALQLFLVMVAFPLLFINSENGLIQAQVKKTTKVDLPESPSETYQTLTFMDGLYWSIITATSIGYGDVVPKTNVGQIIAAVLGVMGVITVGVVAGLVLEWITPRRFD